MNHIELFAGCGGLSLGLEATGFKLLLANELSPMASETFAYNFFNEDLAKVSTELSDNNALRTKWLSSNFDFSDMQNRLREDPRSFPEYGEGICDFSSAHSLEGNLLIADIVDVNQWLEQSPDDLKILKNGFSSGGVDLVSGGPPCQSFSLAGMRELSNSRNVLPWEFAKFVQNTQPKIALLENVSGILRAFKVEGKSYYAWFEVAKAFAQVGYIPLCLHINAKYIGIAQNRPRFILLAIREDIHKQLKPSFNDSEKKLFKPSASFYKKIKESKQVEYGELPYFDVSKKDDFSLFKSSFLQNLVSTTEDITSVKSAIDDLRENGSDPSTYIKKLNKYFKANVKSSEIKNHELRRNSDLVKRRFRIYQILTQVTKSTQTNVKAFIKSSIDCLSDEASEEMLRYQYLYQDGALISLNNKEKLESYLLLHRTKKQTQKALIKTAPAPAALSIPDDACHYHPNELRTLTVREMARIQSFPDNFVFRSKVTTGGKMRRFEVPQYTQVGNAVPPLLGKALGLTVKDLLDRIPRKKKIDSSVVKNEEVLYQKITTAIGSLYIAANRKYLLSIAFESNWDKIKQTLGNNVVNGNNMIIQQTKQQLEEYFSFDRVTFDLPLSFSGTAFQQSAWKALLDIPYGETRSYTEQAATLNNPKAVRAVGRSNGLNPISIVIPCHRVIGKSGNLAGYAGGINTKKYLLNLEKEYSLN